MVKRDTLGTLRFNENLKSGQEYNFISRYLCTNTQGVFIDNVLSKRRVHANSIQGKVSKNKKEDTSTHYKSTLQNKYYLLKDIIEIGDLRSKRYLVNGLMALSYMLIQAKEDVPFYREIVHLTSKIKGNVKAFYFNLGCKLTKTINKGYWFYKKAKA